MSKTALLNELQTLPTGYQEFLNTALPGLPAAPADAAAAQIVCGQLAQYLLDVFAQFAGLHPLKIPAHMAALNKTNIGGLLASLEVAAAVTNSRIVMLYPVDGGVYWVTQTQIRCTADGANTVWATMTNGDTIPLEYTGTEWYGVYGFDPGEHSITITAQYDTGEDATLTINFTRVLWTVTPQDGDVLQVGNTQFELNPNEDSLDGASVSIAGQVYDLVQNTANDTFEFWKEMAAGAYEIVFTVWKDGSEIVMDAFDITVE